MEFNDVLRNALLRLESAKFASGGEEIVVRCPYCGDSAKRSSQHFYIGTKEDSRSNIFYVYDCKHCPASGVLTPSTLNDLQVYDIGAIEVVKEVIAKLGSSRSTYNTQDQQSRQGPKYQTITEPTSKDARKIDYLYQRTGVDFSLSTNISSYKIILNLSQFLKLNRLVMQYPKEIMDDLSENFVGFLSQNRGSVLLRNVNSDSGERYRQYRIDRNKRLPFLYVPPTTLDILTPAPRIVMAEGPFDIICVKNQFFPSDSTNVVFGATGSRGSYKSALSHLLNISGYYGADIDIFADVDDRRKGYEPIIEEFRTKIFSAYLDTFKFTINLNNDETKKDFGYLSDTWDVKRFSLR